MDLEFWNKKAQKVEIEKVYGEGFLNFLYSSPLGKKLNTFLFQHLFSRIYGAYKASRWSQKSIASFAANYQIPLEDFIEKNYASFNEFFIREFRPGKRSFDDRREILPAFCEGKYLAYESFSYHQTFEVKSQKINITELIGSEELAKQFDHGSLVICRLALEDYHHFHFPDNGKIIRQYKIGGHLHSVGRVAQKYRDDIFLINERVINELETENFGKLLMIEVGAFCIGKIIQTHRNQKFKRGERKGHFEFGGSTVILIGQKNNFRPGQEILEMSNKGLETCILLGEEIARGMP